MKTYTVTYRPITGDLRTLDKLRLFELAALLERLQYTSHVSTETIIITTQENERSPAPNHRKV